MTPPHTAKRPFLRDLANFATDVSHDYLRQAGYPQADRLFEIARGLISRADCSTDPAALERARAALSSEDRAALDDFLQHTSLLSDGQSADPVVALDDAMTMHWIKAFGLGGVEDGAAATDRLGAENAAQLESFIHEQVDRFWELDALAEQLDEKTLSPEDMRIVAAYDLTIGDGSLLAAVVEFANVETLRLRLKNRELVLPATVVATLQDGLNAQRAISGSPPVSIMKLLT